MYRALYTVIVLLIVIKLTNAELKEMTSEVLYIGGHPDTTRGIRGVVTMFVNGTRDVLWTNGVTTEINKGKWWINGDLMCTSNEKWFTERCEEWRKNGDRIEIWREKKKQGYYYILD
jgi:hypothetical protein